MKSTAENKILCIGEILWDKLPTGMKAGGAPMNVALHLKKIGFNVRFAGRIGNDQSGWNLQDFLEGNGLGTELLQVDNELATGTVEVNLEANHQVSYEIVDNVAWDRIEITNELDKAANEANVIIYGTLASRHHVTRDNIISLLNKNNSLKLIDVNLRSPFTKSEVVEILLNKADIAKLNDDELKVIAGWHNKRDKEKDLVKWFAEKYGCNMICITRGAKGALLYHKGEIIEHSGYKVNVVDTVGSGDAFLAGFLASYLSGENLSKSLDYACATGALIATKTGGTPNYKLTEIQEMISLYNSI